MAGSVESTWAKIALGAPGSPCPPRPLGMRQRWAPPIAPRIRARIADCRASPSSDSYLTGEETGRVADPAALAFARWALDEAAT
jgi:hypothetical protein